MIRSRLPVAALALLAGLVIAACGEKEEPTGAPKRERGEGGTAAVGGHEVQGPLGRWAQGTSRRSARARAANSSTAKAASSTTAA